MIQKLRFRFICLAMASIGVLLVVIVGASNYLSYMKLQEDEQAVIGELRRFERYYEAIMAETEALVEIPAQALEPQMTPTAQPLPDPEEPVETPEVSPEETEAPGIKGGPGDPQWEAWVAWHKGRGKDGHFDPWQMEPPVTPEPEAEETAVPTPKPTPEPTVPPAPSPIVVTVPRRQMSPEIPYESRYFIVTLDQDGELMESNMEHIVSISEEEALFYARNAQKAGGTSGRVGNYFYDAVEREAGMEYLFLDCQRDIATFFNSLITSALISLVGLVVVFLLLVLVSKRIVRPLAESYQKQKEFISAAGHELRTPLSTISADAEVLEMEIGENEWLTDITSQTKRMAELTNSLLTLSRMDEGRLTMPMLEFSLSELVADRIGSFVLLAEKKGASIETDIQAAVSLRGNEPAIGQLVSILLDNAVKYTTGEIWISLSRRDGRTVLAVENSAQPVTEEQLGQFFDRFYRTEGSRNSETGGYGLGLAIAKEIVEQHHGTITATQPVNGRIRMEVEFIA